MKSAFGPIRDPHRWDAPAPVASLTQGQRKAVVAIFFAGEMSRDGRYFIADDSDLVTGVTAEALIERALAKLCVERTRRSDRVKIISYRYFVKLTERGEWYATTLIQQRGALIDALRPNPKASIPAHSGRGSTSCAPPKGAVNGV